MSAILDPFWTSLEYSIRWGNCLLYRKLYSFLFLCFEMSNLQSHYLDATAAVARKTKDLAQTRRLETSEVRTYFHKLIRHDPAFAVCVHSIIYPNGISLHALCVWLGKSPQLQQRFVHHLSPLKQESFDYEWVSERTMYRPNWIPWFHLIPWSVQKRATVLKRLSAIRS